MRKSIILTYAGKEKLADIITDLKIFGKSSICPYWSVNSEEKQHRCDTCAEMFPRIEIKKGHVINKCPCFLYSSKYLVKRLKEILRENGVKI